MRDFIIALLVGFVLFRALRSFIFRNVNDAFQQNRRSQFNNRREGDVTIENKNNQGHSSGNDKGEYVDYEEIK